jgi:hypothetical protein
MIAVTMRHPIATEAVTFEEPHWSAAKDLIRTLEGQGWSFVGMASDDETFPATERYAEIVKPPFDPLTAGWVTCSMCGGTKEREEPYCPYPLPCTYCNGLGIVVGPPEDGIEMIEFVATHIRAEVPYEWRGGIPCVAANAYRRPA